MPKQIWSPDEFRRLLPSAKECRVVRRDGKVKLKLRTGHYLYTYVTNQEEAEELLREVKVPITEF